MTTGLSNQSNKTAAQFILNPRYIHIACCVMHAWHNTHAWYKQYVCSTSTMPQQYLAITLVSDIHSNLPPTTPTHTLSENYGWAGRRRPLDLCYKGATVCTGVSGDSRYRGEGKQQKCHYVTRV